MSTSSVVWQERKRQTETPSIRAAIDCLPTREKDPEERRENDE